MKEGFKNTTQIIQEDVISLRVENEKLEKENTELKKELDSYKALDSHYDEIEEDAKRIAEENEQLKAQIDQLSNDNHVLKTSFITQQKMIENIKRENEDLKSFLKNNIVNNTKNYLHSVSNGS